MLRSLLIDFNSYFASVEQQLDPALRGRPVGVVPVLADSSCCIAASYEAKAFGVKTGTRVSEAKRLCPDIALVLADHAKYVRVHQQAVAVVDALAPVRQVLSIDEMECELTGRWQSPERALRLAQQIKAALLAQLGPCMRTSVGIAPNTLLAKLASNMHKPDGLTLIEAHQIPQALLHLPVSAIGGIGPRMVRRLAACGIDSMEKLYAAPRDVLVSAWGGVLGGEMHDKLRGQWTPLRSTATRSLGHSHVLPPDMRHPAGALDVLSRLVQKAAMRLRQQGFYASSMSVHLRAKTETKAGARQRKAKPAEKQKTGNEGAYWRAFAADERWAQVGQTQDTAFLLRTLQTLWLDGLHRWACPMSVGVQLHGLVPAAQHTPDLFDTAAALAPVLPQHPFAHPSVHSAPARQRLLATIDALNRSYGKNTVMFASAFAGREHAPMRIAFNRIPDLHSEN